MLMRIFGPEKEKWREAEENCVVRNVIIYVLFDKHC
jgi:hypothetical protein